MFPKTGPVWKQMPISRALLGISFGYPSNGALPLGSPHKAPREKERCSVSRVLLHSSFKDPGTRAPIQVPQLGPYGDRCPPPKVWVQGQF